MGAIPIDDTGDIHFAIRLNNDTGIELDEFSVGYTGQQWRITTSGPTTITVGYQFGNLASDITAGTWTSIDALTFTSPHSNAASASNIGGTLAENSQVFTPVTISSVDWQPDQELWIRFTVQNISGFSQGLAIDDFTFTVVPEPAAYAMLTGLLVLGIAVRRRLRNQ